MLEAKSALHKMKTTAWSSGQRKELILASSAILLLLTVMPQTAPNSDSF